MIRRRVQFGTPFVVVISCSQPAPTKAPDPPAEPVREVRADAAIDAAALAMTPDAAADRCDLDPTAAGCNPPRPEKRTFVGQVIRDHGVRGGVVEFDFTPYDDAGKSWRGKFVDERGLDIPGSDFEIVKSVNRKGTGRMRPARTTLPSQRVRLYEVDK